MLHYLETAKHEFSVQITTFHSIPSKKKSVKIYPYPSPPQCWVGVNEHDYCMQIWILHAILIKKYYCPLNYSPLSDGRELVKIGFL